MQRPGTRACRPPTPRGRAKARPWITAGAASACPGSCAQAPGFQTRGIQGRVHPQGGPRVHPHGPAALRSVLDNKLRNRNFVFLFHVLGVPLSLFSGVAVTNDHQLGGLEQKLVLPPFWGLQVGKQGVRRAAALLGHQGGAFLRLPAPGGCRCPVSASVFMWPSSLCCLSSPVCLMGHRTPPILIVRSLPKSHLQRLLFPIRSHSEVHMSLGGHKSTHTSNFRL